MEKLYFFWFKELEDRVWNKYVIRKWGRYFKRKRVREMEFKFDVKKLVNLLVDFELCIYRVNLKYFEMNFELY